MADWTDEVMKRSLPAAQARGAEMLMAPHAKTARYDRKSGRVVVELNNGCAFAFPARNVQGLEAAKPVDLAEIELLGDGFVLHWPRVNADIRVEGALSGVYGSKAWMALSKPSAICLQVQRVRGCISRPALVAMRQAKRLSLAK